MANTAENAVHPAGEWFWREKAFQRIVLVALGLLLLVTALLKAQGPADGALGQNTTLFPPRLRFLVMEAEAILGLLLLSGWARLAAWFLAMVFFLIVAGISLYLGLMGQSSCGCFGRIHVSPWSAFALDVGCLAALGLCRPSFQRGEGYNTSASRGLRDALTITGGASAIVAVCVGGILLAGSGHPGDFLASLRGEQITAEPHVTDMGSGVAGEKRQFSVRLQNHTDRTFTIIGGTAQCACMATDDLPVTIPPSGSARVTVQAGFKGTPGIFQHEFRFYYTDGEDQGLVITRFEGRIIEVASEQSEKKP